MSLQDRLMYSIKEAMKAKDSLRLEALRAIKSAILLEQTSGENADLTPEKEIQLLQKLVKQRKDSAAIYREQQRDDLAAPEESQAVIISEFLPEQLSPSEIEAIVDKIIADTGAAGMKDMGKVMGLANKEMAGKADGKTIATLVKQRLS